VNEQKLSLYQYDSCPFCARVRDVVRDLGIDLEIRDVHNEAGRAEELQQAMGRPTVPVLRIEQPDGGVRWLPESAEIIAYLQEQQA